MAQEPSLRDVILEILSHHPDGLMVSQVYEQVEPYFGVTERTVRTAINQLVADEEVLSRKRPQGNRGTPPTVYVLARLVPKQTVLLPDADMNIIPRLEVERQSSDSYKPVLEESSSVLQSIARGHVEQDNYARSIIQCADALLDEDPATLLVSMASWVISELNSYIAQVEQLRKSPGQLAKIDPIVGKIEAILQFCRRYFYDIWRLQRYLQIPKTHKEAIAVPHGQPGIFDAKAALEHLRRRLQGDRVLQILPIADENHVSAIATDASVADLILAHASGQFMPPDPVAIMISAAAKNVLAGRSIVGPYQDFDVFPDELRRYTTSRAAKEGLLLSPVLNEELNNGDYKHTRLAAMDLRQYMQDLRVIMNQAHWRPIGDLPNLNLAEDRPRLVIRDGRIFPMVHRLNDYEDDGLYGDIVRNQIETFADVIHNTQGGPDGDITYAGAVKEPQQSWLAPLIFWYAQRRESLTIREEHIYQVPFNDTVVSHLLFLGLANLVEDFHDGLMFTTCRAIRHFSDIAIPHEGVVLVQDGEKRYIDETNQSDWKKYFAERIQDAERRDRRHVLRTVADYNSFIFLCQKVGVSMFYAAPVIAYQYLATVSDEGAGHFLLPRLEVAIDVTRPSHEEDSFRSYISWLGSGGIDFDHYHPLPSYQNGQQTGIPILVPDVLIPAHEAVTFARTHISQEIEEELSRLIAELRRKQE